MNDVEVLSVVKKNGVAKATTIRMGNIEITWGFNKKNKKLKELSRLKPGCRIYNRSQMEISSGLYAQGVRRAYAILRPSAK